MKEYANQIKALDINDLDIENLTGLEEVIFTSIFKLQQQIDFLKQELDEKQDEIRDLKFECEHLRRLV